VFTMVNLMVNTRLGKMAVTLSVNVLMLREDSSDVLTGATSIMDQYLTTATRFKIQQIHVARKWNVTIE